MSVAVFHRVGEPTEDKFTHSIEQILAFDGLITFDGAYTSLWPHREVLGSRKPILFVQGLTLGSEGVLTVGEVMKLQESGFILGWHGWSHNRLTELSEDEIANELDRPDWVDPIYAYPHGDFNQVAIDKLKEMGYQKAYSTTQGDDGDYTIKRIYI